MLRGSGAPPVTVLQAAGERLPFADRAFDFVSMGFALRHLADLEVVFGEFRRVLAPGGRICVLEITRPEGRVPLSLLKIYMKGVVPLLSRLVARQSETPRLWRYYWDTIEACAPPAQVMATLVRCGFVDVERHVELGIFSEYRGRCPA
jgi:demethylmenaquinone methyltransferase/2-methoxy-6-polyprenyl-1,4-benzoquinol methylase